MHASQSSTDERPQLGIRSACQIAAEGFNRPQPLAAASVAARRQVPTTVPSSVERPERIVFEADEVIFRVGDATLSLTKENGGTLEIRARRVRIQGDEIVSEAAGTNTLAGDSVVTEAAVHADLLGKLIRIDGQCVKINS